MAQEPDGTSLMPDAHLLQLFVTMTDYYGYERYVQLADEAVLDRGHRHVFSFQYRNAPSGAAVAVDLFGAEFDLALTFAARATSSFPGAFPPVSIERFKQYLPDAAGNLAQQPFFRLYELSDPGPEGAAAQRAWFVDGGILDNRPFDLTIQAVRERHADVEVTRRLLYLEPDPSGADSDSQSGAPLNALEVLGAVAGIPRKQPILDELDRVQELNERVDELQDIAETNVAMIDAKVACVVGRAIDASSPPDSQTLGAWQAKLHLAVKDETSYGSYLRSKIAGVIDDLGTSVCAVCDYPEQSSHAFLVNAAIRLSVREQGLLSQDPSSDEAQATFLTRFDFAFGARRLQFVLAKLNGFYPSAGTAGAPTRRQLDALKARLWHAIVQLRGAFTQSDATDAVRDAITACFPEAEMKEAFAADGFRPAAWAADRQPQLLAMQNAIGAALDGAFSGFSGDLYDDLRELTGGWPSEPLRELLVRYVGFAFWDLILYPIQSVADAGEGDRVEVRRMSPINCALLAPLPGTPKLYGTGLLHFKAFFERRYRENDYLWGRLDGAERLVDLLFEDRDIPDTVRRRWCGRLFEAILEEEQGLDTVRPLRERVAETAAKLTAS
jgi:patatin-related protein